VKRKTKTKTAEHWKIGKRQTSKSHEVSPIDGCGVYGVKD